jgi:ABC-type Zn uptake system ZnuABC Zn-binding protein ZnuA
MRTITKPTALLACAMLAAASAAGVSAQQQQDQDQAATSEPINVYGTVPPICPACRKGRKSKVSFPHATTTG